MKALRNTLCCVGFLMMGAVTCAMLFGEEIYRSVGAEQISTVQYGMGLSMLLGFILFLSSFCVHATFIEPSNRGY